MNFLDIEGGKYYFQAHGGKDQKPQTTTYDSNDASQWNQTHPLARLRCENTGAVKLQLEPLAVPQHQPVPMTMPPMTDESIVLDGRRRGSLLWIEESSSIWNLVCGKYPVGCDCVGGGRCQSVTATTARSSRSRICKKQHTGHTYDFLFDKDSIIFE
jgi:hypothetical protein